MRRPADRFLRAAALLALVGSCAAAQQRQEVQVSPAVQRVIDAPYTTPDERVRLRAFHGLWTPDDLADPATKARVALLSGVWDERYFGEKAPLDVRAEAALRRGEPQTTLALLPDESTLRAVRLRAEAFDALGQF
ncbi:MAG: hypothetical protein ACTS27_07540, partial [Phycisphaerales bacterium]